MKNLFFRKLKIKCQFHLIPFHNFQLTFERLINVNDETSRAYWISSCVSLRRDLCRDIDGIQYQNQPISFKLWLYAH